MDQEKFASPSHSHRIDKLAPPQGEKPEAENPYSYSSVASLIPWTDSTVENSNGNMDIGYGIIK